MERRVPRTTSIVLLLYGAASFVHFVHNAELLAEYPGLPTSWTRTGVYPAWCGITVVGLSGWLLVRRGSRLAGLCCIAVYALLGFASLGHFIAAPVSAHSAMMQVTIGLEVTSAAVLLMLTVALMVARPPLVHVGGGTRSPE